MPTRVEIEALRGEFTDAVMMHDYDRLASLFTEDGALLMPDGPVELNGREEIGRSTDRGGRDDAGREARMLATLIVIHPQ